MYLHNRIYLKFLALQVPVFLLVIGMGLYVMAEHRVHQAREQMSVRVGGQVARIANLMADEDMAANPDTANQLLSVLMADAAIVCAEVVKSGAPVSAIAVPRGLGCSRAEAQQHLSIPLAGEGEQSLQVGLTLAEIDGVRREWRNFSFLLAITGVLLAFVTASFAFGRVVGRPVEKLLAGIREATTSPRRISIQHRSTDELGVVIQAFNAMQDRLTSESDKLRASALTDLLTGLPNRAGFNAELEGLAGGRESLSGKAAIMLIDLDNFKWVNDTYGHQAGDALLVEAARRIRRVLCADDVVARLGGDEFAVICRDLPDEPQAEQLAMRIIDVVAPPIDLGGALGYVSASIGVTYVKDDDATAVELLRQADQAMYLAKNGGKGRHEVFNEASASNGLSMARTLTLIEDGLANGWFQLFYQPIVDLRDMRPVGFEALLRLMPPGQSILSIEPVIRVAEETGQMDRLGIWILQEAARNFAELERASGQAGFYVSVNLSTRQLNDAFLQELKAVMLAHPELRNHLVLEITETATIKRFESANELLAHIRTLGVRIAIDDFGTGYSSLSHISRLPVDIIKIDRSYIDAFDPAAPKDEETRKRRALVRATAALSHELNTTMIAEGIESVDMCQDMMDLGITFGQGYGFSRPMPRAASADWLRLFDKPRGAGGSRRTQAA